MPKYHSFFVIIFLASTLVFGQEKNGNSSKKVYHVLFVGNSLTYINNLPELVKNQAALRGISVDYTLLAFPDYAIIDHWKDGKVQKLISSQNFDFVIIQQGPSSQNEGREMLLNDGQKYSELCQLNHAKLCYFMVWPALTYYHTFNKVIGNYSDAAKKNHALLLPVGKVWKTHFDDTSNFDYYGSDGFHPSLKGSQVAAKIIVENLFFSK
ncbi:SGNH/GDSL hydrolase family protein [Gaetbulibacter aestuarii]|uniref:SGNH/GDSL hydrolase family protein n=1 Tax=Gaetbulibacter aestuarii TaxID=1502358 RepID=A0ABW7MYI7_9FLAO